MIKRLMPSSGPNNLDKRGSNARLVHGLPVLNRGQSVMKATTAQPPPRPSRRPSSRRPSMLEAALGLMPPPPPVEVSRKEQLRQFAVMCREVVFNPNSWQRQLWDGVVVCAMIWTAAAVPWISAFDKDIAHSDYGAPHRIDRVVDAIICMDVIVLLKTCTFDEEGMLVTDWKLLARNYIRTYLIRDIVSIPPWDMIIYKILREAPEVASEKAADTWRLLRLIRLIRLSRLRGISARIEGNWNLAFTMYFVIVASRFILVLALLVHVIACGWFLVARVRAVENNFPEDCWVAAYGLLHPEVLHSMRSQYSASLYWAIQTLMVVGFGDVPAVAIEEFVYSYFAVAISSVVFSYVLGTVGTISGYLGANDKMYQQKAKKVMTTCAHHELPRSLTFRIRDYFDYRTATRSFVDEVELLHRMSPALRTSTMLCTNRCVLQQNRFLRQLNGRLLREITGLLEPHSCIPGDYLAREGTPLTEMFFVVSGDMKIVHGAKTVGYLHAGSSFGEWALLPEAETSNGRSVSGPHSHQHPQPLRILPRHA
jgi:hypothetical protein